VYLKLLVIITINIYMLWKSKTLLNIVGWIEIIEIWCILEMSGIIISNY